MVSSRGRRASANAANVRVAEQERSEGCVRVCVRALYMCVPGRMRRRERIQGMWCVQRLAGFGSLDDAAEMGGRVREECGRNLAWPGASYVMMC